MVAEQATQAQIVLAYRRVKDRSTGHIAVEPGSVQLETFENEEFHRMLSGLARAVAAHPDHAVIFVRLDHPHLQPFALDPATVELFRTDPVAAIHSMSYVTPALAPKVAMTPVATLRAGWDTMADALGDTVFFKIDRGGVACPGCGQWGMLVKAAGETTQASLRCRYCPPHVPPMVLGLTERWAFMATPQLFLLPLAKFYLPLAWNEGGWITRQALDDKYKAFQAEKEIQCSSKPLPLAR